MVVTGVVSLFNFEPLKLLYCVDDVLVFPVYLFYVNDEFSFAGFSNWTNEKEKTKRKKNGEKHLEELSCMRLNEWMDYGDELMICIDIVDVQTDTSASDAMTDN